MALKLDILANTRQFVSEMKKAGASTEEISDALNDVARDGQSMGGKLEKTFRELAKAGEKAGSDVKKGVGDGLRDVSDEAKQSGREAAASFSGEWTDVGDFVQETVANGLSGFGPIGTAAGIAAAAGLGVVLTALGDQAAATDELKQKFIDLYKSAAEEGRTFLTEAEIQSLAIDLYFDPSKREAARKDAEKLGVDLQTAIRAQAGDQDALAAIIAKGNEEIDRGTEKMRAKAEAGQNVFDLETASVANLEALVGKYESILGIQKDNEQAAREVKELQDTMARETLENTKRAQHADQTRWEALGEHYQRIKDAAAAGIDIPVRADTSRLHAAIDQARREGARGVDIIVRPGKVIWD
ncbi:hypothetical protein [Microbacterium sp. NPDC056569]|uniref:hypothetical protein n=1 Tax=Microbacterium sp. NPDC056569 TaxID=3345867 RepID=UPI003670E905